MAAADRPNKVVMDPGGVSLCHGEELRRRGDPRSLDQISDDRMAEISAENAPSQPGKSEVKSRGHIPSGHLSGTEWKWTFSRVCVEGVKPDLFSNLSRRSLGPMSGDDQIVENGLHSAL